MKPGDLVRFKEAMTLYAGSIALIRKIKTNQYGTGQISIF